MSGCIVTYVINWGWGWGEIARKDANKRKGQVRARAQNIIYQLGKDNENRCTFTPSNILLYFFLKLYL